MSSDPSSLQEIGRPVARAAERLLQQWLVPSGDEWGSSSSEDSDIDKEVVRRRWRKVRPRTQAVDFFRSAAVGGFKKAVEQLLDIQKLQTAEHWRALSRGVCVVDDKSRYHFVPAAEEYSECLSLRADEPTIVPTVVEWRDNRSVFDELKVLVHDVFTSANSEELQEVEQEEHDDKDTEAVPQTILVPAINANKRSSRAIIPAPGIFVDVKQNVIQEPRINLPAEASEETPEKPGTTEEDDQPMPQIQFQIEERGQRRQLVNWCFIKGVALRAERPKPWCELGRPLDMKTQEQRRQQAEWRSLSSPSFTADLVCEHCYRPILRCHTQIRAWRQKHAPNLIPPYAILFLEDRF